MKHKNCTWRRYDRFCNSESCITAVKLDAYNTAGNGRRCDLEWQNSSSFYPGNYPAKCTSVPYCVVVFFVV